MLQKMFCLFIIGLIFIGHIAVADVTLDGLQPRRDIFSGTITDSRYNFIPTYSSLTDQYGAGSHVLFALTNNEWYFNFHYRFPYQFCSQPRIARFVGGQWQARVKIAYFDPRFPVMSFWTPANNDPYAIGSFEKSSIPSRQVVFANIKSEDQKKICDPLTAWIANQLQPNQTLVYYEVLFCVKAMLFQETGTPPLNYCVNDATAYNGEYRIIIWFDQSQQPQMFTPSRTDVYTHNVNCNG